MAEYMFSPLSEVDDKAKLIQGDGEDMCDIRRKLLLTIINNNPIKPKIQ